MVRLRPGIGPESKPRQHYLCSGSKVYICICGIFALLLIKVLAGRTHPVNVRQHEDENPNVALMYVGLIAGTPISPKLAFSVDLLTLFYHLRRRQPSIGIQGFVKAVCAFQQVRF
jgi:hypothetical protein